MIKISLTSAILVLASIGIAHAQVYKCPGANGGIKYQGTPCQAGQAAERPTPQQTYTGPSVAQQRYQQYNAQQAAKGQQRYNQRLDQLNEGQAYLNRRNDRIAEQQREQALKREKDCQRDLRLAQMRGKHVDFTCTGAGFAARPRVYHPAPINTGPAPPTTQYVPSLGKTCTDFHNGAPPHCF